MLKLLTFLLVCKSITAQAPHVGAVVSAADFKPGLAVGGIGTLFGTGLSDAVHQFSNAPYPAQLGPTQAFLCLPGIPSPSQASHLSDVCVVLGLIFASPAQVNFMIPETLPTNKPGIGPGATLAVIVNVGGALYASPPFSLLFPQPRIFTEGYDCFIDVRFQDANKNCGLTLTKPATYAADRGAVTDQSGRVLSSSNPARLGQYYTIWMTGLGAFNNGKIATSLGMSITNVPVFGYKGDTSISVTPSYVGPSPQFPGLYQVNFQLPSQIAGGGYPSGYPPLFPCGDYSWEVSLDLSQGISPANLVQIPVIVKTGDVACAK